MQKMIALATVGLLVLVLPGVALAVPQFQAAWFEKYLPGSSEEYQKLVKEEVKCFLCHQGKIKKNHNVYGKLYLPLLKKTDKGDAEKIMKAIEEVGAMHTDPEDENSPTYADLIAKGELPGGKLEDVQKEPEESTDK
jgi:hypothetical protein